MANVAEKLERIMAEIPEPEDLYGVMPLSKCYKCCHCEKDADYIDIGIGMACIRDNGYFCKHPEMRRGGVFIEVMAVGDCSYYNEPVPSTYRPRLTKLDFSMDDIPF